MRNAAAIIVCLAFVSLPFLTEAQQDTRSNSSPVVAYLGTIKYAVRKSPPSPLGYYYSVNGATQVEFHECGSVSAPISLSRSEIIDTSENCGSLPGTPSSPLSTNVITSWSYQSNTNAFIKTMLNQDKTQETVQCRDVPATIIAAAKNQQGFKKGIAAEQAVDWKSIEAQLNLPSDVKEGSVQKPPVGNDCVGITKFWTLPLEGQKASTSLETLGLTVADPGNLMMVHDLEKQLKAN